jgi:hypothetical protein
MKLSNDIVDGRSVENRDPADPTAVLCAADARGDSIPDRISCAILRRTGIYETLSNEPGRAIRAPVKSSTDVSVV